MKAVGLPYKVESCGSFSYDYKFERRSDIVSFTQSKIVITSMTSSLSSLSIKLFKLLSLPYLYICIRTLITKFRNNLK